MSEGGGNSGPEIAGTPNFGNPPSVNNYTNPPSQPPTPSSTVQDTPSYNNGESESDSKSVNSNSNGNGLPPFSSFSAADVAEGLGGRLAGDGYLNHEGISSTRIMELSGISGWDYCYTSDGRYVDSRGEPLMISQPQYRPWESKQEGGPDGMKSGLPSFQSQFGEEMVTTLTTLTPAACSPAPSVPSPGLPSFHTLSAVNPRYPLVPAPIQAREIPSIQQQFLDERHIHLFPPGQNFTLQSQNGTLTPLNNATTLTTLNNAQYHINNAQILPGGQILTPQSHILSSNGHIITSSGGPGLTVVSQNSTPTVLTVVKAEPVNIVELKSSSHHSGIHQLHHPHFQNSILSQGHHMEAKYSMDSPPRGIDGRKKERRKIRASSLESSNESDGAMSVESSGQVAAVSSTAGFKSPMNPGLLGESDGMMSDNGEKQTKKKRKRCGECIGCQRKDNCGDCAPCRNDKSHQICKMRRCEKLTEKKHLLAYNREDSGGNVRGRGRGRGRGSRGGYRGKAPRQGSNTSSSSVELSSPALGASAGRENGKIDSVRLNSTPISSNPSLPPTMAVPFYGNADVWPPAAAADTWTAQGQFVPQMDDLRYQHYPGYQTPGNYQQTGFASDSSAFQPQYGSQPSSSPAQGSLTPRSSNYTQVQPPTPSPIGSNPPTPHVNGHRNGISVHYVEEGNYVNGNSFSSDATMVPPPSTTPASRCSSAHAASENGDQPAVSKSNYTSMSGNDQPGYPPSSPQQQSLCNSNGYPGQAEYGEQNTQNNGASYQDNRTSPAYSHQSYQNYNQISPEQSPNQKQQYYQKSPGFNSPSPGYEMYDQRQFYGDYEKNNVNARIKNMIMSKQGRGDTLMSPNGKDRPPNDYGGGNGVNGENGEQNHFLAVSHHLREGSRLHPGGGGCPNWTGPAPMSNHNHYYAPYDYNQNNTLSAMEKFMKFASADFEKPDNFKDPIRNLEANFPTKKGFPSGYYPKTQHYIPPNYPVYYPEVKVEPFEMECNLIKKEPMTEEEEMEEEEECDYPKVSYAPKCRRMLVVDRRFEREEDSGKWKEYQKKMEDERKDGKVKVEEEEGDGYSFAGEGGPMNLEGYGAWCCRQGGVEQPSSEHLRDGCCQGLQTADEVLQEDGEKPNVNGEGTGEKKPLENGEISDRFKNIIRSDVPECSCFPPDKAPPEPGSYYTHLGTAATLKDLREDIEQRLKLTGKGLRIEKINFTGKEGKTTQGCPLAKWVIRRSCEEEKFLALVKQRQGHSCTATWIVVCIIAWEGLPSIEADKAYNVLTHKLHRFGLPTTRRCATNEPRTCACQGLDPETCGTSFSFGCSWSMYYNGCKYARSKTVRKFRLSVRSEEQDVEERMHVLATILSPLYNTVAPEAFRNQTQFEREASECRLGFKPGRPFSGVTACVDFCAHAHRDLHNMSNGCTVVVSLTKHRENSKPDDEQLHVLPMYVMDETDEFGSKEDQEKKYKDGSIECLNKFPCEVRMRSVPLQPCRRHGKKRRDDSSDSDNSATSAASSKGKSPSPSPSPRPEVPNMFDHMDSQLQSSQVSSTVRDSPGGMYHGWNYPHPPPEHEMFYPGHWNNSRRPSWQSPPQHWRNSERDVVDADSTTAYNQAFSPCSNRSKTSNSSMSPVSSPRTPYNWHPSQHHIKEEEVEEDKPPNWGDYPSSPSPIRQSPTSPFRIPKGRPPSRQTHVPEEQRETFLKPLPRDNQDHIKTENPFSHGCASNKPWGDYDNQYLGNRWEPYCAPPPFCPPQTETKAEPLGEVTDFIDNEECFRDSQMGGIGIALGHGAVLFEVAKHELHATTALKRPNRAQPARISLIFYQHRNLNRGKHGWEEWEEKMRLRKLGTEKNKDESSESAEAMRLAGLDKPPTLGTKMLVRASTFTTTTWTTLFPMRPCMVTGPYQEGGGEQ